MNLNSKYFVLSVACLAAFAVAPLRAEEAKTLLRWKNGDVLPGNLLESQSGQIRWSSEFFSDDMVVDSDVLDSIIFPSQILSPEGTFRVGTASGDVFTADLIGSDENTLLFSSDRFGEIRVKRSAIYSLDRRERPNLVFDGSQLQDWQLERRGPIKDLTYKVYEGRFGAGAKDFSSLEPSAEGRFAAGWIDVELSQFEDNFGMTFEGRLEVQEAGNYSFEVSSDDGSRLLIDGKELTNNRFGNREFRFDEAEFRPRGEIELSEGSHSIRVDYFENGGEERLDVWWTGPDFLRTRLFGTNPGSHWSRGPGGHPRSTRKRAAIFREIELPKQFEMDIELASSGSPRFVVAIGEDESSATSNDSFRLETWDNELVAVQDTVFEPVLTIEEGQSDVRLRLAFDTEKGELEVFDLNGSAIVTVKDIYPVTGKSGIFIRNRGHDLTVRRFSVSRQSSEGALRPIDFSKARVHLADGQILYGLLYVDGEDAYVVEENGTRQDIDLDQLDRVATAAVELSPRSNAAELTYADGAVLLGRVESVTSEQVVLRTAYSDAPVRCTLAGASFLRFAPSSSGAESPSSDSDQLLSAFGRLRGELSFDLAGSPLSWKPEGVEKSLRLAVVGGARIERSRESSTNKPSFDESEYPFVLHLKNGERIPCQISSYDEKVLAFRSPFIEGRQIGSVHMKAIEFDPWTIPKPSEQPSLNVSSWIDEFIGPEQEESLALEQVKLDRALTVPRFNRQNPPSHILVASNGDMKRGKLMTISGGTIQFESKLRPLTVPLERIAQVVNVSEPDEENGDSAVTAAMPTGTVRAKLADGSILVFEPIESRDGKLWGRSSIYGEMYIPIDSIRELSFGDFEVEKFASLFREWVVRPAKEPDFGK